MTRLLFRPNRVTDNGAASVAAAMAFEGSNDDGVVAGDCGLSKCGLWSASQLLTLVASGSAPLSRMPIVPKAELRSHLANPSVRPFKTLSHVSLDRLTKQSVEVNPRPRRPSIRRGPNSGILTLWARIPLPLGNWTLSLPKPMARTSRSIMGVFRPMCRERLCFTGGRSWAQVQRSHGFPGDQVKGKHHEAAIFQELSTSSVPMALFACLWHGRLDART